MSAWRRAGGAARPRGAPRSARRRRGGRPPGGGAAAGWPGQSAARAAPRRTRPGSARARPRSAGSRGQRRTRRGWDRGACRAARRAGRRSRAPTPRAGETTRRGRAGAPARARRRAPPPPSGGSGSSPARGARARRTARAARRRAALPRGPRRGPGAGRTRGSSSATPRHDHPFPPSHRSPILRRAVAGERRPRRRAPERELLHSHLREPGEVRGQRVAVRPLVLLEPPAVPDLEEIAPQADERDIFPEPRLLPAVGRKQNASRAVELDFLRARDPEPADATPPPVELRLIAERADATLPRRERVHVEALILGHDDQVALVLREHISVFRRNAHPAFRVDRVLVASNKHFRSMGQPRAFIPLCPT